MYLYCFHDNKIYLPPYLDIEVTLVLSQNHVCFFRINLFYIDLINKENSIYFL
jgi:hypothetical protein